MATTPREKGKKKKRGTNQLISSRCGGGEGKREMEQQPHKKEKRK